MRWFLATAVLLSGCVATGVICEPAGADTDDTEDTDPNGPGTPDSAGDFIQTYILSGECGGGSLVVPEQHQMWTAEACADGDCRLVAAVRHSNGVVDVPCQPGERRYVKYFQQYP